MSTNTYYDDFWRYAAINASFPTLITSFPVIKSKSPENFMTHYEDHYFFRIYVASAEDWQELVDMVGEESLVEARDLIRPFPESTPVRFKITDDMTAIQLKLKYF